MTHPRLVELREAQFVRQEELIRIGEKEDRSAEDDARIDVLIAEMNEIGPKLAREMNIDQEAKRAKETISSNGHGTNPAGIVGPNGQTLIGSDGKPPDLRGIADRFLDSDELKDYRAHPAGKSHPFGVGSFYQRSRAVDLEARTLIYSGGTAASLTAPQVVPSIYGPRDPLGTLGMRDVLNVGTTTADAITYIAETGFTNAAGETAEAIDTTTGAKPESALTLTEATVPVVTIAHWIPITRQALDDAGQLRAYIEGRLIDGLHYRETQQVLVGNGTAPNMRGILNTTGIQNLDATYFTGAPVAGVGTGVENYNRILRGKTLVQTTGLAVPTFYVINPSDWEGMIAAVNTAGVFYGGGPFAVPSPPRIWGLPVVLASQITAKTVLVGDGTMATIWDRMAAQVFVADQHADFFIRNIFVLLAEERIALTVHRPAAFAKVLLV